MMCGMAIAMNGSGSGGNRQQRQDINVMGVDDGGAIAMGNGGRWWQGWRAGGAMALPGHWHQRTAVNGEGCDNHQHRGDRANAVCQTRGVLCYFLVLNLMQIWMLSNIQVFLCYFPVLILTA